MSLLNFHIAVQSLAVIKVYFFFFGGLNETLNGIIENKLNEIMKPGHPRWHEFQLMLQGKDGCNFSEDENGKVTGHIIGLAKISVTTEDGNYKTECTVAVSDKPATEVRINKNSITIKLGKEEKLTALVGPGNADIKDVIWTSDSSIIEITEKNGKHISIVAKSTGTAKVTVTSLDGGYTATCEIIVIDSKK